jgi:hypothetical protein
VQPTTTTTATTATTATTESLPVTAAPATTTTAAGPEVVVVTVGESVLTFTLPAGTTPEDREIYARYIEFRRVMRSAMDPPDPANAELPGVIVARYHSTLSERLRLRTQTGQFVRGPWSGSLRLGQGTNGAFRVEDCGLDASGLYDLAGATIDAPSVVHTRWVAILDDSEGQLKVRTFVNTEEPCAV